MLPGGGGGRGRGGRFYWVKKREGASKRIEGIVVVFAWVSIHESELKNYVDLYACLGWNSLVCLADFLNPFFPEKATSLAFSVLSELIAELRSTPCPVVLASCSGGSKACMYKVFQIIEGTCGAQLNLDDSRMVMACISGQIYDSSPIDFADDLGARFAMHPAIRGMPGLTKLVSLMAKGVTSGLDALFLTRFSSQCSEYWQTLYSSVGLGTPFLILCSECDDLAPYPTLRSFAHRLQELGASVKLIKWKDSSHAGHVKQYPIQYRDAVAELLEQAISIFTQKMKKLCERNGMEGMNDMICELICDLQNAAVDSNQSLRRVATGPNDHFFLPSSSEHQKSNEQNGQETFQLPSPLSLSPHTVLGQVLFDACVPKNVEGWDVKFSGSLNGQPLASASKRSPLNALKLIRRSRL